MNKARFPVFGTAAMNRIPHDVQREATGRRLRDDLAECAQRVLVSPLIAGLDAVGAVHEWSLTAPVLGRAHRLAHRLYWGRLAEVMDRHERRE